jgi:2-C-methyl-D-erythritol 4-phosphate cytidylyltransferase
MRNTAIILAGGKGERAGFAVPKQFAELAGRTVIERTVDAFERHPMITGIVIVTIADCMDRMQTIVERNTWHKFAGLCSGGFTRFASANAGLMLCPAAEGNVLIHDGARPLVGQEVISRVITALEGSEAVITAVPSTDSLVMTDGGSVESYLDRSKVWRVQTPQGFRTSLLRSAYLEALRHSYFDATDDAMLIRRYFPDRHIAVVEGSESNIKLTYPGDMKRMEQILATQKQ